MRRPSSSTHIHRILAIALCSVIINGSFAQRPGGGRGGGRPAIGKVYGRVLDASTHKGVGFATVSVFAFRNDSLLGGALVAENGDFTVERLPIGPLKLHVAFLGYKALEQRVVLTMDRYEQDLGNLMMETDEVLLKAAEVTREGATQVLQVDRRVYNVEKDLSVKGGTAADVMKNIPGLTVDVDNKVELRGKNPQIMVDGKPTTMTLEMIPSSEIERVEVITNPSVVFDASSHGGIVNVVLKKSTQPGYSGQVQMGAGTNDRYQGNGNLLVKEGRTSVTLSGSYNTGANPGTGYTDRTDLVDGTPAAYFSQDNESTMRRTMRNGRLGIDYKLSVRNTITFSQNLNGGEFKTYDTQHSTTLGAGNELLTYGDRINDQLSDFTNWTTTAGFKRTTLRPGKEWTTDLTYNFGDRASNATFSNWNYAPDGSLLPNGRTTQHNVGGSSDERWTWQADVTDPYKNYKKIEWGFKASYSTNTSHLDADNVDETTNETTRDTSLSNAYKVTDIVNAAYVNWSTRLDTSWSLQAGLRFEQTWFEAQRTDEDLTFSYKYPDGLNDLRQAIFPALYLVRRWNTTDGSLPRELQFNLSRKINRPGYMQVMPFVMFSDSRSYRIGNPTLAPEMNTIGEINHLLPFKNSIGNWLTSLFGRLTENVITSFTYPLPSDPNILVSTFVNGKNSWSLGWENTVKLTPLKGTEFTVNGNIQWVTISLTTGATTFDNSGWNWNGKANLSQRLPKEFTLQINGNYEGPRVVPQGHTLEQYSVDATLAKDIGKKWSLILTANDVFNTRRFGTYTATDYFIQETSRRRDTRFFRLSVTWRFGEREQSLFRRKQQQRREPGAGGGDQEAF